MSSGHAERPTPRFFLFLLVAASVLLVSVILPVGTDLILAAGVAAVCWPIQRWLSRKLRGRSGLSAGILTVVLLLLVLGPIATLLAMIVRDGSDGLRFVQETVKSDAVRELVARLPAAARKVVNEGLAEMPRDVGEAVGRASASGAETAAAVTAAVAATGSVIFHGALFAIAVFFMLLLGDELVGWLDGVSPLRRGQTRELLVTFKKVAYAVIVATVVTSAVQALAALIGFYIARVPNPVFFGALTFFVAFVPAIGAAAVCLVAAGLLLLTGHPYMAAFLAAWGLIVVGLSDNVVRPLLTRRGVEIHGAVVFFALLGGLATFGSIGLLIGPLAISFFLALLRMYHRDYSPDDDRSPAVPGLWTGSPPDDGRAAADEAGEGNPSGLVAPSGRPFSTTGEGGGSADG
jgi:predicted PurR-regulated permease PerM